MELTEEVAGPTAQAEGETDDRPPVLFHANAPWVGSGYGTQTALFGPRIADLGYRLAFSAFTGLKGSRIGWVAPNKRPFVVYPAGNNPYGNDVIGAHASHWFRGQKGLVILLTDPWVMHSKIMQQIPTLAWTPVDHEPLMPVTHDWFQTSGAIPLAMSRFGEESLRRNGFDPLYAPHAFDPSVFRPMDRAACRRELGVPDDAFVVGMVAANRGKPSRKCFFEAIAGFNEARKKCGREMILYLHTQLETADGEDIAALCASLGVTPMVSDQYAMQLGIPPESVAAMMSAFDVLLNPAQGEGFGVPQVEAQACGTPVICTDFAASPEVAPAAEGNWNVDGTAVWTGFNACQLRPDIEQITAALVEAYEEPEGPRQARRERVAAWALQEYEIGHVMREHWKHVMQDALLRIRWADSMLARA